MENTGYWNTGNRNTGDWNTGWLPIATAPENTPVLIVVPNSREVTLAIFRGAGRWGRKGASNWKCFYSVAYSVYLDYPPTHWRPLPAPPQPNNLETKEKCAYQKKCVVIDGREVELDPEKYEQLQKLIG